MKFYTTKINIVKQRMRMEFVRKEKRFKTKRNKPEDYMGKKFESKVTKKDFFNKKDKEVLQ